jgi:(E)-4-hydroxy-3-methylbut-2-enyl-diphosphate synthase
MGCIVNGPGEMADADYGYVGSGAGKITLYKGRTVVKRDIDQRDAVDELVAFIEQDISTTGGAAHDKGNGINS